MSSSLAELMGYVHGLEASGEDCDEGRVTGEKYVQKDDDGTKWILVNSKTWIKGDKINVNRIKPKVVLKGQ